MTYLSCKTKHGVVETNIRQSDYLFLDSETFGECSGYPVDISMGYGDDGPITVRVHLHLEDDHPSVQDAMADHLYDRQNDPSCPEMSTDSLEFYDDVPPTALRRGNGEPVRVYLRPYTSSERAERARARGFARLALPELDAALRKGPHDKGL